MSQDSSGGGKGRQSNTKFNMGVSQDFKEPLLIEHQNNFDEDEDRPYVIEDDEDRPFVDEDEDQRKSQKKSSARNVQEQEERKLEMQDFSTIKNKNNDVLRMGDGKNKPSHLDTIHQFAIEARKKADEISSASSFDASRDDNVNIADPASGGLMHQQSLGNMMQFNRETSNFGLFAANAAAQQMNPLLTQGSQQTTPQSLPQTIRLTTLNSNLPGGNFGTSSQNRGLGAGIFGNARGGVGQSLDLSQHRGNNQNASQINDEKKTLKERRTKLVWAISQFNYAEPVVIFMLLLNDIVYSNYISSFYFAYSLLMLSMAMTTVTQTIKTKFYISIFMSVVAFIILLTKCVKIFFMMKDRVVPTLTSDDIFFFNNLGIYIIQEKKLIDNFNSLFYDFMQGFLALILVIIIRKHFNDVNANQYSQDESTRKLLHPHFDRHIDVICHISIFVLAVNTIFIQTILQAFIVLLIFVKMLVWAYNQPDLKHNSRYYILTFSQGILIIQMIVTFILQIPAVEVQIVRSDIVMVCDMFGLLLHNIPKYAQVLHLLTMSFAVSFITLFKVVRLNTIKNMHLRGPLLIGEEDPQAFENKSDISGNIFAITRNKQSLRSANLNPMRMERNKSIGGGSNAFKVNTRPSAVVKIREKTIGVKNKIAEQMNQSDDSFNQVAQKYYTHFSPQLWLWTSRLAIFIWVYAYHDFQSWIMLLWLMHSTLFKSTRTFIGITITYYLPVFCLIFLFYYVINIPRVFEFQKLGQDTELDIWRTYGFYQFSVPALEVGLMMTALVPFIMVIKTRKQLDENSKADTKQKFLEKLTDANSPTIYYFLFVIINNLDLVAFITIFFSGVNKIDFYHIFLIFFFVAFILWPKCFIRNYVVLLFYVDFFVFEKYLYTLITHYIPKDSWFIGVAQVLGLSTEYDDVTNQKYFRYKPKFQQWLLIIVVFLQFQVHQIFKDERLVNKFSNNARDNFKKRYPRIYHIWEIVQHLKKEFLILFSFMIFFMIIIITTKSVINWGFQIILCVFIITYIGVSNDPSSSGIKRLSKVWFLIIWYSSLVLILQISYQFAALPIVRNALDIDDFLNLLPMWIRQNIDIIGFTVYTTFIWEKFLIYLLYFAIGVYVKKSMTTWDQQHETDQPEGTHPHLQRRGTKRMNNVIQSINSDRQPYDDEGAKKIINWQDEFTKIRFTTPYLVYKVKKLWVILDKISQSSFVIISVMIMILSNYWQISLSMAIHLTCFIGLCLLIASKLYSNRKKEKKILDSQRDDQGKKKSVISTVEECGKHWTEYKKTVNLLQVEIRQRVWLFQFIFTLLCMVAIYPTEFIYQIRQTFIDQQEPEVVTFLNYLIFYLFWGGVYHSPYNVSGHGYFYNFYGYLIILVLLVFEKNGQQWALNRFGCTSEKAAWFKEIEENLIRIKKRKKELKERKIQQKTIVEKIPLSDEVIHEEAKEESFNSEDHKRPANRKQFGAAPEPDKSFDIYAKYNGDKSKNSLSNSSIGEHDLPDDQDDLVNAEDDEQYEKTQADGLTEVELRDELKKWIMKKYRIKILNGVKIFLEDSIQFLLLISSVYKDSVIGLLLLLGVLIFMLRRKIKQMQRLAWIVGLCMILQYGLALSNLTSDNNPMDFPAPFNPYPKNDHDEGEFIIPWYRKIPLLRDNFDWAMYLGMGISNTKLNGLWIDYFIMGCIQAHLLYFGCQLFTLNLKIEKGKFLQDRMEKYCLIKHGETTNETIKKESKKLKHQVTLYNIYKYLQVSLFMHFHQVTIVVTLLLAVLARSLFSFGYIIVCMIMIYENHKFFRPKQENFRLQKVLKFWLQPYVYFDLTLQLVYQIPLEFLHRDQDLGIKWCWQNIIGFQDIWIKDVNNVDEVVVRSIMFIILKAFTYYFVTLQIQIFDSTAYQRYIDKDFRKFIDMADTKGNSIIWRMNNRKIEKIKQYESENVKMNDMLDNLKTILKKWSTQYNQETPKADADQDSYDQKLGQLGNNKNNGSLMQTNKQSFKDDFQKQPTQTHRDLIDELGGNASTLKNKKLKALGLTMGNDLKKSFSKLTGTNNTGLRSSENRQSFLKENLSDEHEMFGFEDEELLEKVKAKLGFMVTMLIYCKQNFTEQIIFIDSYKHLQKVGKDMQAGKITIHSKFERKMLSDIRDYRVEMKKKGEYVIKDIEIKDMKRTSELVRWTKVFQQYLQLIVEIIATNSDYVCYLFMILSMMKNAGLISLVYPFIVFGYGLMEEANPKKKVWYGIMIYTEILILIKFLYQLQFWEAIFWDDQIDRFQDLLNAIHIGLQRKASGAFGEMLFYFLPEILILFAIMSHIQKEIVVGLLYRKEEKMESIKDALIRYIEHSNHRDDPLLKPLQYKPQASHIGALQAQNESISPEFMRELDLMELFEIKFEKEVRIFNEKYPERRLSFHFEEHNYDPIEYYLNDDPNFQHLNHENINPDQLLKIKRKKASSLPADHRELEEIFKELQQQDKIMQDLNTNIVKKANFSLQRLLYKNSYFERLFPSVKEQKPGQDLYAVIATFQFLICIFLIFFYTKMDADVTGNDSLTYNQFSGQMVIALFMQILVMIIDRYMYKSKTFISTQESNREKRKNVGGMLQEQEEEDKRRESQKPIQSSPDRGMSVIEFLTGKKQTQVAPSEYDDYRSTNSEKEERRRKYIEKNIHLESTIITLAIVSKFYLQWILLIIVHLLVFWFFPIHGNEKLQNHAYCVKDADKLGIKCNEFGGNLALICFYILYCCYFWVSAMQIREGVPEIKKGSFMMNSYSVVNKLAFQGFMAIPFLFELKTFVDWTFTKTALDVFQWFILTATHAELFVAKCVQGRYQRKPLGRQIPWYFKVGLGGCGQFGIILLIAGPLLLFSNFNPISTPNPVQNAMIKFNILVEPEGSLAKNTINLFTNNYVTQLTQITPDQFTGMRFSDEARTKSYDMSLVQYVKMNNFADANWAASLPNRLQLKKEFENQNSTTKLSIQLFYQFERQNQNALMASGEFVQDLKQPGMDNVLKAFTRAFSLDCDKNKTANSTIYIPPPFFSGVQYLNDKETVQPERSVMNWKKGLRVFYSCENYWKMDQVLFTPNATFPVPEMNIPNSNLTGISFFTFSSKIAPSYFKYSIITFYISIVLVIGKVFRGVCIIGGNRVFIWEIPNSEKLLLLCECVYIYRMRSQLDQEEQLYFTFVDIMRSPEMIKAITGSSLKKKAD